MMTPFGPILVATDFSAHARHAAGTAEALGQKLFQRAGRRLEPRCRA